MTTDEPGRVDAATPDLAADKVAMLHELFPGAFADGVVDAARIGELVGMPVAGLKEGRERYGLMWAGKQEAVASLLKPSRGTLIPDMERSIDFENARNVFIEGDNLEVLKILQKSYNDQVKLIYIDPPYNTGNDFVYNDDFSDGLRGYLEYTGQVDSEGKRTSAVSETSGRRHSGWLSMMYPRLVLARNLLKQDGAIFVSIDDNEAANLRLLLDEIFGPENFIAQIIRNTNSSKNQSLFVSVSHEYCLVYARNVAVLSEKHRLNKWSVPKNGIDEYKRRVARLQAMGMPAEDITEELKQLTNYPRFIDFTNYWYFDERGLYRKGDLGGVKNGNMEPLQNPLTGKLDPVPPGGYRFNAVRLSELVSDGRVHFHTDGSLPTIKRYLDENEGQRPKSIMSDDQRPDYALLKKIGVPFDNPKQMSFMKRIISIADPDAIVMDFFAGSGTTGQAVAELNEADGGSRRYVLVQLPEPTAPGSEAREQGIATVSELTLSRLNKTKATDSGVRVLTLAESVFAEYIESSDELSLVELTLTPSASAPDISQEVFLREGVRLDRPWAAGAREDAQWYASGGVTVVTDLELTQQAIDAAIASNPRVLVFLEDAFAGKDALKASAFYACKQAGVTMKTV